MRLYFHPNEPKTGSLGPRFLRKSRDQTGYFVYTRSENAPTFNNKFKQESALYMKTELISAELSSVSTELLVVFALDTAAKQSPQARSQEDAPEVRLLTTNEAVAEAAGAIRASGEYAAASAETVLLHAPVGLKAKRLLLVGLGKLNLEEIRKAAGTAVRFAKTRNLRELSVALPATALPATERLDTLLAVRAWSKALLGDFDPDTYRSDRKDKSIERLTICSRTRWIAAGRSRHGGGKRLWTGAKFARSLVNEPGNRLTPYDAWTTRRGDVQAIRIPMRSPRRKQAQGIEDGGLLGSFPGLG